jgi:hypothetical protein
MTELKAWVVEAKEEDTMVATIMVARAVKEEKYNLM